MVQEGSLVLGLLQGETGSPAGPVTGPSHVLGHFGLLLWGILGIFLENFVGGLGGRVQIILGGGAVILDALEKSITLRTDAYRVRNHSRAFESVLMVEVGGNALQYQPYQPITWEGTYRLRSGRFLLRRSIGVELVCSGAGLGCFVYQVLLDGLGGFLALDGLLPEIAVLAGLAVFSHVDWPVLVWQS